jgi:hypothetical protein
VHPSPASPTFLLPPPSPSSPPSPCHDLLAYDAQGNDVRGQLEFYPAYGRAPTDATQSTRHALRHTALRVYDPRMYEAQEPPRAASANTWLLRWFDAATTRDGVSVTMEGRNATAYRYTNIDTNGYGGGTIFQVNMAAIFDPTGQDQYFENLFRENGIDPSSMHASFDASTSNLVSSAQNSYATLPVSERQSLFDSWSRWRSGFDSRRLRTRT